MNNNKEKMMNLEYGDKDIMNYSKAIRILRWKLVNSEKELVER